MHRQVSRIRYPLRIDPFLEDSVLYIVSTGFRPGLKLPWAIMERLYPGWSKKMD